MRSPIVLVHVTSNEQAIYVKKLLNVLTLVILLVKMRELLLVPWKTWIVDVNALKIGKESTAKSQSIAMRKHLIIVIIIWLIGDYLMTNAIVTVQK